MMKQMMGTVLVFALGVQLFGVGCKTMESATNSAGQTGGTVSASPAASKPSMLSTGMQGVSGLIKMLGGGDDKAKAGAKQSLLAMGAKAIPPLLSALRGGSASTQKGALDVLGSMGSKASGAKGDVQKLTTSKDPSVAAAANDTLKKIQ